MPQAETQPNGLNHGTQQHNNKLNAILPGTTFPEKPHNHIDADANDSPTKPPTSIPGPLVNNAPTTLTLITPAQLAASPLLPSLEKTINDAFASQGHSINGVPAVPVPRLRYEGQLLQELSTGVGTFTFILHPAPINGDDTTVLATASAKRYVGHVAVSGEQDLHHENNTFTRFGPVAEGREIWELSTMAVDPGCQRQGVAGYLMRVTEAEVVRRFSREGELVMALTTIKEVNEGFYARRGFATDYEVVFPVGHLGSPCGFTITHMSKGVVVDGGGGGNGKGEGVS